MLNGGRLQQSIINISSLILMDQSEALQFKEEGFMEKGVDTRKKIQAKEMTMYPYNCLLMLIGEFQNDKFHLCIGTAFLINEYYALTVAHNLWDKKANKYIQKIRVYPAVIGDFNFQTHPEQSEVSKKNRIFHKEYLEKLDEIKKNKSEQKSDKNINLFDYALIRLNQPIKRDRYLSIAPFIPHYQKRTFEVSGYSGYISSKEGKQNIKLATPLRGIGKVKDISSEKGIKTIIQHRIDTSYGQSGSPLMVEIDGTFHVVGIHFSYSRVKSINFAIHLNENKIDHINHWMKKLQKNAFPHLQILKKGKLESVELKQMHNELYYYKEEEKKVYQLINASHATHFKFNWDITTQTEKQLRVSGKQITKKTKFEKNNYAHIQSIETLPKLQHCSIKVKIIKLTDQGMIWVGIINETLKGKLEKKEVALQDVDGLLGIKITKDHIQINGYSWKSKLPLDYKVRIEDENIVLLTSFRDGDNLALMVTKEQKVIFKDYFTKQHQFDKDHYLCAILKEKDDSIQIMK